MTIQKLMEMTDEEILAITYDDLKEFIENNDEDTVFLMIFLIKNIDLIPYIDRKIAIECLNAWNISKEDDARGFSYILDGLDDKNKLEEINKINDSYIRALLICTLEDDKLKMQVIKQCSDIHESLVIARSFKNERFILDLLYFNDIYFSHIDRKNYLPLFMELLLSLKSDDLKDSYINNLNNPQDRAVIINSYKSNDLKLEYNDDPIYKGLICIDKAKVNVKK